MSIIVHELENNIWSATYIDESIKWEIVNQETKEPVVEGYYDGYNVADRLLERVLFKIEVLSDKRGFKVSSLAENYDYLHNLNMHHWMHHVASDVATADCLSYHTKYVDELVWEHMLLEEDKEDFEPIKPIAIPAYNVEELLSSILGIPRPVEENEHNKDVLSLLKPVGFSEEDQIENLARLMAKASNFYNEGEDRPMTDEDWMKQGDAEKFRWIARYVVKNMNVEN